MRHVFVVRVENAMLEITNSKSLMLTLLALLCTSVCGYGQEARRKLEDAASRLPFLIVDARLTCDSEKYDNEYQLPPKERDLHRRILLELVTADYPTKELLPLLKHVDPKVRTLAILALYNKEDGRVLPHINLLVKDNAPAFGAPKRPRSAMEAIPFLLPKKEPDRVPDKMPELHPQAVGYVAEMGIQRYLDVVPGLQKFEEYWAVRKDREYCASWFLVRLQRVTMYGSETRNRVARLKAIRMDIDRLPGDDRTGMLLWLGVGLDGNRVSQKELIDLCKKLGDAKLLKLLAGEKVSDDPDLHHGSGHRFVLDHAREVMTKDAAAPLLKLADASAKKGNTPYRLYLAAAELQPEKADEIRKIAVANLKEAFKTHSRREDLDYRIGWAHSLWTVAGTAESKFLVEWFYTEKADAYNSYNYRRHFVANVASERPKENRAFLAQLVRDPRFDQLDWGNLMGFVRVLNGWTKQPIVTEPELRHLDHPVGQAYFRGKVDGDRYPKETAHVLKTLATWRQKVRDSVPEWNPEPKGPQGVQSKIEDAAKRLPYLILDASLSCEAGWSDDLFPTPRKACETHRQILLELVTADHPTKDLLPLLKHMDPKVRTLAILGLVNKEDPKLLPAIHALVKDTAPTFGRPPADLSAVKVQQPEIVAMPGQERQTVGDVAARDAIFPW
ncbi:MAG: hypothetical protein EXS16_05395 [Gemmataceae bacterium]|nr:hypothetical protein [Gemmataceae bacterium]